MTDKRTRRCIITFRVSSEEYALLKEAYEQSTSRSLSDYARDAVMHKIAAGSGNHTMTSQDIVALQGRIESLEATVKDMVGHLDSALHSPAVMASHTC